MVFPVPAEPETRAGPLYAASTIRRCAGCRKTVHFSHGNSSARSSSLCVLHEAESALRVRMCERVRIGGHLCRALRCAAGCELQQRLRRLSRQVVGEIEQRVLVRAANVVQPRLGDAVAQQLVVRGFGEERRLGGGRRSSGGCLHDDGAMGLRSRARFRGPRRSEPRRSSDAARSAVAPPIGTRRRDGRHRRAGRSMPSDARSGVCPG